MNLIYAENLLWTKVSQLNAIYRVVTSKIGFYIVYDDAFPRYAATRHIKYEKLWSFSCTHRDSIRAWFYACILLRGSSHRNIDVLLSHFRFESICLRIFGRFLLFCIRYFFPMQQKYAINTYYAIKAPHRKYIDVYISWSRLLLVHYSATVRQKLELVYLDVIIMTRRTAPLDKQIYLLLLL
jgi:hypothetical protein